jgi:CBS domain containing-hemolysin-like protein
LLEEIVGEINDEFDEEVREQIRKDGETYVLDGLLTMRDANLHLGLDLPENESYTTIAGFLMAKAGRILEAGDSVEHDEGVFTVERVEHRRISRIRFVPTAKTEGPVQAPGSLIGFLAGSSLASYTADTVGSQLLYPI